MHLRGASACLQSDCSDAWEFVKGDALGIILLEIRHAVVQHLVRVEGLTIRPPGAPVAEVVLAQLHDQHPHVATIVFLHVHLPNTPDVHQRTGLSAFQDDRIRWLGTGWVGGGGGPGGGGLLGTGRASDHNEQDSCMNKLRFQRYSRIDVRTTTLAPRCSCKGVALHKCGQQAAATAM